MKMSCNQIHDFIIGLLREKLPPQLSYHNVAHTLHTIEMVEEFAAGEGVSDPDQLTILRLAALFHDTGFMFSFEHNEGYGAQYASEMLRSWEYAPDIRREVANLIMTTAIPQRPCCKLGEILCDADLEPLGNEQIFLDTSINLRKELACSGICFSELEWLDFEISFLSNHKYFTAYARRTRNEVKEKHLQKFIEQKEKLIHGK